MKKKAQVEEITRDMISHEFIPYACHYSPETILTKNGELIQFIKISDSSGSTDHEFRQALRKAINSCIDPSKYAVWIHTVRSKSAMKGYDEGDYLQYVDYLWRLHLPSEIHFTNDIYLSIVIDSSQFEPWKARDYVRSLSKKAEERFRISQLAEKEEELEEVADNIMEALSFYKPEKLGLYEHNGLYHSEIMELTRNLMGVNFDRMQLPLTDISHKIRTDHIDFNSYSGIFETRQKGKRRFGAVISIKENIGITAPALQNLLNSDSEYIISQAVDFAFGNRYLPAIRDQFYINTVSADKKFMKSAHLEGLDPDNADNFVLQQVSISVVKNSVEELNKSLQSIQKDLQQLGIVAYVEDINLERTYWANLPGNFSFLKRQTTMPRELIGNFACFGVDKYSAVEDCLFGKPVIMFENQDEEIFALHFLNNGQGHILIVGAEEDSRQMLASLIATYSQFAGAGIIFFDAHNKYKAFADAVQAEYMTTLDLDLIASRMDGTTKVVVINSLKPVLDNNGHDAFLEFVEYAGSKNCIVIACEGYENNSELLLSDFTTTIFFPVEKVTERFADNYDIFEDERQVIEMLAEGNLYARHGHEDLLLRFTPSAELQKALVEGKVK